MIMNDLLVISNALEQGIYVKDFNEEIRFVEPYNLMFYRNYLHTIREVRPNHYEFLKRFDMGDYKKTWSLQKEDLYV